MVFFEPQRKLAGTVILKGDEESPAVKLGPVGSAKGRLLNPEGTPAAGVVVSVRYTDRAAREIHEVIYRTRQVVTAADGTFTLDDLIPAAEFALWSHRNLRVEGLGGAKRVTEKPLRAMPAQTLELGDLRLTAPPGGGG
jgi:hypothetical protein